MVERRTGSWIVKRTVEGAATVYLISPGPFSGWIEWDSNPANAHVFPTKKAAREALHGHGMRGITIERSYGHEEHA